MSKKSTWVEHVVAARVHGRVLVREPVEAGRPMVVGCHGYGEDAAHQLAALARIPGAAETWTLAAAEALHPFYNRRTGDVVGSWMTKRLRDHAIVDNTRYVHDAVTLLRAEHGPVPRLVLAGFSQGVAMAYRAAAALAGSVDGLVVLAGDVPADVVATVRQAAASLPPILLGRGTRDDWYTAEKMDQDLASLRQLGVPVEPCVFDGGHTWSPSFLAAAGAFLERVASSGATSSDQRSSMSGSS